MSDGLRQRRPVDQFHHQRKYAAVILESVNLGDVWVIQRSEDARFPCEADQAFRVGNERRGQDLDGDVAPELGIPRAIDLAHTACAERLKDFVRAESCAGSERQGVDWIIEKRVAITTRQDPRSRGRGRMEHDF